MFPKPKFNAAPEFSFLSNFMPLDQKTIIDPLVMKKQKAIRFHAVELQKEVTEYLENVLVPKPGIRPDLPIFFVQSYNFLKKEAKAVDYEDPYLNFIPVGTNMQLLTEYGPSDSFPKILKDGQLEVKEESLGEDTYEFLFEISLFVARKADTSGKVEKLPISYHLALKGFERMVEDKSPDDKEKYRVESIPWKLQELLEEQYPGEVGPDFVERCSNEHKMDL